MIDVLIINSNIVLNSGITVVFKNLIENTTPGFVRYSILTQYDSRNGNSVFEKLGIKVYIMPKFSFLGLGESILFWTKFFKQHQFDIIHSHFSQIDRIVFPIAKKNGVKKCISHSHSSKLSNSNIKAYLYKIMCYNLSTCADFCAACSESAGIALYGKSFPKFNNKIIIKNGIDCQRYKYNETFRKALRKEYNIPEDCYVIGHVGRFCKEKNQSFLIQIIKELTRREEKYMLALIGDGKTKEGIEHIVSVYSLNSQVLFLNGRSDVDKLLNMLDLFIMPSLHEGLGIAAIEAQANGLECILSNTIPKEADLTGVTYLGLDDSTEKWADVVMSKKKIHHENYNTKVIDAGYDIKRVGNDLTEFYKRIVL